MKRWRLAIAALAALCLSACLPVTTKTAVGQSAGFVNDPALEGSWAGKADEKDAAISYFHFLGNDNNTLTLVGVTTKQGDEKGGWGVYALTTATLGGHHYINARETNDNGKPATPDKQKINIPLLYTIGGGTLTLYLLDEDKVRAAITAHRIDGTITKSKYDSDETITADAAHLDAWLKSADAPQLFKVFMVMHKVR